MHNAGQKVQPHAATDSLIILLVGLRDQAIAPASLARCLGAASDVCTRARARACHGKVLWAQQHDSVMKVLPATYQKTMPIARCFRNLCEDLSQDPGECARREDMVGNANRSGSQDHLGRAFAVLPYRGPRKCEVHGGCAEADPMLLMVPHQAVRFTPEASRCQSCTISLALFGCFWGFIQLLWVNASMIMTPMVMSEDHAHRLGTFIVTEVS